MTPEAQRVAIAEVCGVRWDIRSLDAMHQAEKVLDATDKDEFYWRLVKIIGRPEEVVFANAAQHAEAFLRTLKLWTAD